MIEYHIYFFHVRNKFDLKSIIISTSSWDMFTRIVYGIGKNSMEFRIYERVLLVLLIVLNFEFRGFI